MKNQKSTRKGAIIFILLMIVFIPAIWFLFLNKENDLERATEKLTGKWLRYDGTYTIDIQKVNADGTMDAAYFNPNRVKVGVAQWKVKDDKLNIMVELTDTNYDGSYYLLSYDKKSKYLVGIYYQAVAKETYEVSFSKQ